MRQIMYPKPIPPLEKESPTNENGFTLTEIAALQNGWRLIRQRLYFHSTRIFRGFFQENDTLLEKFRNSSGNLNMTTIHQHSGVILQVYGNLIDNGLNNPAYINIILSDISQIHRKHGVTYNDVKLQTDHILVYIIEYLHNVISSTFKTGLEKLSDLIQSFHLVEVEPTDESSSTHSSEEILEY